MNVLDVILEDTGKVYAIGDSLAVGIAKNNALAGSDATGGIQPTEVLNRVNKFVKSGKAQGATVILGTGAPNNPSQTNLVGQQIDALKSAGATVVVLGAGPKIPKVDAELKNIANQHGAKYVGPLGSIDASMAKGDGIHMSPQGYKEAFRIATGGTPIVATPKTKTADKPAPGTANKPVPNAYGVTGAQYDDKGNYIRGSYLKSLGINLDLSDDPKADNAGVVSGNPVSGPGKIGSMTAPQGYYDTKGVVSLNASLSWKAINEYLKSKGIDTVHRQGILVNIEAESSFRPGVLVPNDGGHGPSGGLFGHHDDYRVGTKDAIKRFTNMVNATGGGNKWQQDWKGQIDFALSEAPARLYLNRHFRNAKEAVGFWVEHFERPRNWQSQMATRAHDFLPKYAQA